MLACKHRRPSLRLFPRKVFSGDLKVAKQPGLGYGVSLPWDRRCSCKLTTLCLLKIEDPVLKELKHSRKGVLIYSQTMVAQELYWSLLLGGLGLAAWLTLRWLSGAKRPGVSEHVKLKEESSQAVLEA